ncbi:hypothetical protein ACWD6R_10720 [Streptomyces sp. NPDC005151]
MSEAFGDDPPQAGPRALQAAVLVRMSEGAPDGGLDVRGEPVLGV